MQVLIETVSSKNHRSCLQQIVQEIKKYASCILDLFAVCSFPALMFTLHRARSSTSLQPNVWSAGSVLVNPKDPRAISLDAERKCN